MTERHFLVAGGTRGIGQMFVKIYFSGICGSQLGEIDGAIAGRCVIYMGEAAV